MQEKRSYLKPKSPGRSASTVFAKRGVLQHSSASSHALPNNIRCACGGFCPACHSQNPLQAKFRINSPNDRYEQEADRVADKVVASESQGNHMDNRRAPPASLINPVSLPTIQRQPDVEEDGGFAGADSETDESEMAYIMDAIAEHESAIDEGEEIVQAKPKDETGVAYSARDGIGALSSGKALPESSRAYFRQHMGVDFSPVRIHSDERAAEAAESINARAYTLGRNVVFNKGEYSPYTREGRHLLAHELTHVLQQSGGGVNQIQRRRKSRRRSVSNKIPGTTSSKTKLFFSDLNSIIKGMSGRTSNLSLSNYNILSPAKYVAHVAKSPHKNIKSEYTSALATAKQACGAPLRQIATTSKDIRKLRAFRANRRYCRGSQPTHLATSIWMPMRGYTPPGGGRSVIFQESNLDKLLHLLVHEGIHRMQGKEWRGRSMPTKGYRQHSVRKMTRMKPLSEAVDEGATQILTLEVIKKMQGIKGRSWFTGFTTNAYASEVQKVRNILSKHSKNIDFLKKAYFSNTSYREVEDIQLWQ